MQCNFIGRRKKKHFFHGITLFECQIRHANEWKHWTFWSIVILSDSGSLTTTTNNNNNTQQKTMPQSCFVFSFAPEIHKFKPTTKSIIMITKYEAIWRKNTICGWPQTECRFKHHQFVHFEIYIRQHATQYAKLVFGLIIPLTESTNIYTNINNIIIIIGQPHVEWIISHW